MTRSSVQPRDDLELAQAASQGDRDAQRRVVSMLMDRVRNSATYLAGRGPDAEDMAQLAIMEVLRSLPTFAGRGGLESWAGRIAVRSIYTQLRRRAARRKRERSAEDPQGLVADLLSDPPPEGGVDARELRRRVMLALEDIKEHKRVALVMKLVHGYTVEEIAEITDTPFETVRSRLRHARNEFAHRVRLDSELTRYVEEMIL